MAGPLTNQEKSREFYRFAYACEEQRKKCDHKCAMCTLNVHLYCDDPREATLIKTSARLDYSRREPPDIGAILISILGWVMIGAIIYGIICCTSCTSYSSNGRSTYDPYDYYNNYWNDPTVIAYYESKSTPKETTSQIQGATLAQKTYNTAVYTKAHIYDIDRDGRIDCTDYATVFYENYPDKSDCHIMWIWPTNTKSATHLYVRIGGYDIEPQNTSQDFNSRLLRAIWGNKLDYTKVRDITYAYNQIKAGTFNWVW
jgi:hypothetical protein